LLIKRSNQRSRWSRHDQIWVSHPILSLQNIQS